MSVAIVERFEITPLPNGATKLNLHLSNGSHVDFIAMRDASIELVADLITSLRIKLGPAGPSEPHGHPGECDSPNPAPDA
jgi:hypothetical protein